MKKVIKKLKQNKGETLIESLVSMLIAVLSMGMLCTSVMASAKINAANEKADKIFAYQLNAAETMTTPNYDKLFEYYLTLSFQMNGAEIEHVEVKNQNDGDISDCELIFYGGVKMGDEDIAFLSYDYKPDTP